GGTAFTKRQGKLLYSHGDFYTKHFQANRSGRPKLGGHRFHTNLALGPDRICSRIRIPSPRMHSRTPALCYGNQYPSIYSGAYYQGRVYCRTEGAGTYGGYSSSI